MLSTQTQSNAEAEKQAVTALKVPRLSKAKARKNYIQGFVCHLRREVMDTFLDQANGKTRRLLRPISYARLARQLVCSKSAIIEAVSDLVTRGWIVRIYNRDEDGAWKANTYEIWCDIRPGEPYPRRPNGRRRQVKPRKQPQS